MSSSVLRGRQVHRLGDLIARLKVQFKLTSLVVTHDTRLAEKL